MHGLHPEAELREKASKVESEYGNKVDISNANLLKPQEIRDMVDKVVADHGRLDILVNNAGIQFVAPVEEFPEEKWDDIIAVILNATFHASKAALPHMLRRKWGRIVNTGSMHALVASPYKSAYNAAKHGVAGFTKTLALEVGLGLLVFRVFVMNVLRVCRFNTFLRVRVQSFISKTKCAPR